MKSFKLLIISLLFLIACSNQKNKSNIEEAEKMIDISKLEKVHKTLDLSAYWRIVDFSISKSKDAIEQEQILIREISKLSPKEIIGFRLTTDKLLYDTYTSEMWCAGYIMNNGCSDDGFEYFRNWIISKGEDAFNKAKKNPDTLVDYIGQTVHGFYEFESFWYVALEAFKLKTGKNLYDYIDYDKFKTSESNYPNFKFNWNEDNPETMKAICPNLYSKLWN